MTRRKTKRGDALSFFMEASIRETDDCIPWPFYICKTTGYSRIKYDGRHMSASRAMLIETTGQEPDDHDAAHAPNICHDRTCINKRHLRWATRTENHKDKRLDGTQPKGSAHHNAKLTEADALSIRADGRKPKVIALDYNVKDRAIRDIKARRLWKHV